MMSATAPAVAEKLSVADEMKTAARHSAVYGLGNMAAKAIGFLMVPFYTHYLSPADYGILEILDLSMSLFGMFLAMGMISAMLRAYAAAPTPAAQKRVISTAFAFTTVTGVAVFLLAFEFVKPASALLFGPKIPSHYLLISLSSFLIGYVLNVPRTYLRAREASGAFVAADSIALALTLLLNIVFIAVLRIGVIGILLSTFIVSALQVVLLSAWMLRETSLSFDRSVMWGMLAFGFPLMFSNMALFVLNFSDRFFLQHLRSLEIVGIYAVGYKFGYMLNYLLVQPFMIMWQGRMYAVHRNPDHEAVLRQMFVLFTLVLTFVGLALSIVSPEVVHIMVGSRFAAAQDVIPVVTFAYVWFGIGFFAQTGMYLADKTSRVGAVSAAAAVLNIVLNYLLISRFGMAGAAWATLLSFIAMAVGSYWLSWRSLPLRLGAARAAGTVALAVAIYVGSRIIAPTSLITGVAIKMAVLLVFPLAVWKSGLLAEPEMAMITSAWRHSWEKLLRFTPWTIRGAEGL